MPSLRENDAAQRFQRDLARGGLGSVQQEWDTFQLLLTQVLLEVCARLSQGESLPSATRDACLRAAVQRPCKGQLAQHIETAPSQAGVRHQATVVSLLLRMQALVVSWLVRCLLHSKLSLIVCVLD